MSNEAERMQILDMIERGKISAEDGLVLLQALVPDQVDLEDSDLEDGSLDDTYSSRNQSSPDLSFQAQSIFSTNHPIQLISRRRPGRGNNRETRIYRKTEPVNR